MAHQFDPNTLSTKPITKIQANSITEATPTLGTSLPVQPYALSRSLGAFILVNPHAHQTCAAGLALDAN